jgi:hypothetical protein
MSWDGLTLSGLRIFIPIMIPTMTYKNTAFSRSQTPFGNAFPFAPQRIFLIPTRQFFPMSSTDFIGGYSHLTPSGLAASTLIPNPNGVKRE